MQTNEFEARDRLILYGRYTPVRDGSVTDRRLFCRVRNFREKKRDRKRNNDIARR